MLRSPRRSLARAPLPALLALATSLALAGCAGDDGEGAPPDVPRADAVAGDAAPPADGAPAADGGDATQPSGPFRHEIITHEFPEAREDIATGDYFVPAVRYDAIEVDPKYTHVLSFQMTPWAFPLREATPSYGPLVLFSDDMDVLVFSPLDHFFVSLVDFRDGRIESGIEGEVEAIPAGFVHRFLLVEGEGLNATIARWGELLRAEHGAASRDRYADVGVSTLGYWTDNGSAYFFDTLPGQTYEDTLLTVKAEADALGIPYGYFQIDSWWYARGPDGVRKGGIYAWEPQPEIFPDGLPAFRDRLGLPLVAHSKWFEKDNAYVADHTFVEGENWALPLGRGIYDRFMADAVSWGIVTYEPDWLQSHLTWEFPYLRRSVDAAEVWMHEQGDAALDHGLTMQLCMAGAAHLMYTVEMPAVLTFRTSIDYHAEVSKESFWPMFHTVNMLAAALGVMPFKDNFHSGERYGAQEALVSILSAGMVGVGDAVGEQQADIILRTCRADGVLLKPDRPATPLDAMFLPHERPYAVHTWSERPGYGRQVYVAAFHLASEHPDRTGVDRGFAVLTYDQRPLDELFVFPEAVTDWTLDLAGDLGLEGRRVVYDWRTGEARVAEGRVDLAPFEDLYDFGYLVIAPVLANGLALIGEPSKYVTLADRRFTSVEAEEDAIRLVLEGAPGEAVPVLVYDADAGAPLPEVIVTLDDEGRGEVSVGR